MRKIILLLTLCIFAFSQNLQALNKKNCRNKVCDTIYIKIDTVIINLETEFNHQAVKIIYNDKTVYNKTITTDESTDRAGRAEIKTVKDKNLIKIISGTSVLVIDLMHYHYKYICVRFSPEKGLFVNEASNIPIIYE